ncbi:hypothetical protein D3C81_1819960 [compost metagenome]
MIRFFIIFCTHVGLSVLEWFMKLAWCGGYCSAFDYLLVFDRFLFVCCIARRFLEFLAYFNDCSKNIICCKSNWMRGV